MTGIGGDLEAVVNKEADTHTAKVTNAVKAAATPANGGKTAAGDPTDVQEQVVAVLAANPPSWLFLVGAFAILGAGVAAGYVVWRAVRPSDFLPSSNYAVYAGLFIMALAIERILEPFAGYIVPSTTLKKAQAKATAAKVARAKAAVPAVPVVALAAAPEAAAALVAATKTATAAVQTAQSQAAVAEKEHHRSQANRAVLMWALASTLAMVVCAWVGIFLLRSVETPASTATAASTSTAASTLTNVSGSPVKKAPSSPPNRWVDLVVTGLVVGAGTKPLHDLITNIQSSASGAKATTTST